MSSDQVAAYQRRRIGRVGRVRKRVLRRRRL